MSHQGQLLLNLMKGKRANGRSIHDLSVNRLVGDYATHHFAWRHDDQLGIGIVNTCLAACLVCHRNC